MIYMASSHIFTVAIATSILLCLNVKSEDSEDSLFTSITDLKNLLLVEDLLVSGLNEYIKTEEAKLKQIRRYIEDYESLHLKASVDSDNYIENPLNSFHLIKKMTVDWTKLKELLNESLSQTLLQDMSTLQLPTEDDMTGAAKSLTRLQDIYNISANDMANGNLNEINYGVFLTDSDCYELGRHCYKMGDYNQAKTWLNQALKMIVEGKVEKARTINKGDIFEYLALVSFRLGDLEEALRLTLELIRIEPDHPRASGKKSYFEERLTFMEEEMNYQRLCRGEEQLTDKYRSNLFCRYSFGFHPYLKLAPHQEEDVFLEPRIVIYHNVLTDKEIEYIKRNSATMHRAQIGVEGRTSDDRISEISYLRRNESEEIDVIYRRVGDITGLNMEAAEPLQVSNYGIGGHYETHFDFFEDTNSSVTKKQGNRIATWLFYESDVVQGGATVFPRLRLRVKPRKGSAIFWFNLLRSGEGDQRTLHAACPVLVGNKWVSNFWIRERGQEFIRPCSLDPSE